MSFLEAIITCLKKYATFNGRAERSEFWYWALLVWILSMLAFTVDSAIAGNSEPLTGPMFASSIVNILTVVPSMAVSVRRLHDVGRSGWWFLIVFTGIGGLLLLYWYVLPSRYGYKTIKSM